MVTREQCRAARGLLGWTQQDLAFAAGLSKTAINNYERGLSDIKEETLRAIRRAFTLKDLEFIADSGVKRASHDVRLLPDGKSYLELLDDILSTRFEPEDELLITNMSAAFERSMLAAWNDQLRQRYTELERTGPHRRILLRHNDQLQHLATQNSRWIPEDIFSLGKIAFIYGKKVAFKLWYSPQIVLINSASAAHAERENFEKMWTRATPLP